MLRAGELEGIKLGRDWLIDLDHLEKFATIERKLGRPRKHKE